MNRQSVVVNCIMSFLFLGISIPSFSQNIGIGTTTPLAKLHVVNGSVAFTEDGTIPPAATDPPVSNAGRRMMWYPDKAAFRAGEVDGQQWDNFNTGNYSFAAGLNTKAAGLYSIAMGAHCNANGESGLSLGRNCTSSGSYSVAMGYLSNAASIGATAIGYHNLASGVNSIALGQDAIALGANSISIGETVNATDVYAMALGQNSTASGQFAITLGNNLAASGDYSMALGSYVSTSGFEGCLTIGDHSTTTVMGTFVANGFRSRFAGGYRLFTNSAATVGAFLNANSNSWAALSDVRLKENFLPVDGESFLKKIAAMQQYTWNYIGQDSRTLRHYGPMAQDFYSAFGKDELGEIGCDTLINQQDFLGVNLIAIQALEKRTAILQQQLEKTMGLLETTRHTVLLLEEQNSLLRKLLDKKNVEK